MLSKKKNKKYKDKYHKIKYYTPVSLETVTAQEIHDLATQVFGLSYYVDYDALATSQSPMV